MPSKEKKMHCCQVILSPNGNGAVSLLFFQFFTESAAMRVVFVCFFAFPTRMTNKHKENIDNADGLIDLILLSNCLNKTS